MESSAEKSTATSDAQEIARGAADTLRYLRDVPEADRRAIGELARQRVLAAHTAAHRAEALESYAVEAGVTPAERAVS